jgi:hypothetical protein
MVRRAPAYALTLLVLSSFAVVACDSDSAVDVSPTGPSRFVAGAVTTEPSPVSAEFRARGNCVRDMPFDARINVHVRPRQEVIVQTFGFEFVDSHRRRVRPLVFPGAFELNNSVLLPIPLPTSHPIPFPGEAKMSDTRVPAGAFLNAPFRLQFDCGVPARGTLFVSVETADRRGTVDVSRSSVQIGH